jgi:hypothetical protein
MSKWHILCRRSDELRFLWRRPLPSIVRRFKLRDMPDGKSLGHFTSDDFDCVRELFCWELCHCGRRPLLAMCCREIYFRLWSIHLLELRCREIFAEFTEPVHDLSSREIFADHRLCLLF